MAILLFLFNFAIVVEEVNNDIIFFLAEKKFKLYFVYIMSFLCYCCCFFLVFSLSLWLSWSTSILTNAK